MLSCYVRNFLNVNGVFETLPFVSLLITLSCHIAACIYITYLGIAIFNHKLTNSKRHFKKFFMKYLLYGLIFILFAMPTILLYIFSINQKISSPSFLSYLSYVSALSSITMNFFLCMVNIFFGHVKLVSLIEEVK